jgi:Cu+-exporting ATPase
MARHSTHPHSLRIRDTYEARLRPEPVDSFAETPGGGIEGIVQGQRVRLGSPSWLASCGVAVPASGIPSGSISCLALDEQFRGTFVFENRIRPDASRLLRELASTQELALLSGDNERERERFRRLFGDKAQLLFNQSPLDKLGFVRRLQESGKSVMMVGDGLNDAGALKQGDVGVAVVEHLSAFSPGSDIIMEARQVANLGRVLDFARKATAVVRVSFGISALYNVVGLSIAAAGILSPLICAVLMPVSSISVVLFACGTTRWLGKDLT